MEKAYKFRIYQTLEQESLIQRTFSRGECQLKRRIPFELSSIQLTENGFTPEFEAKILQDVEEAYAAVANGAATYKSAAELREALDSDDDDDV